MEKKLASQPPQESRWKALVLHFTYKCVGKSQGPEMIGKQEQFFQKFGTNYLEMKRELTKQTCQLQPFWKNELKKNYFFSQDHHNLQLSMKF